MSLTDFVKNMTSDNIEKLILYSFDEVMVLYNFIGSKQDIEVCTETDGSGHISFTLLMESSDKAKDLCGQLNGQGFTIYGRTYHISMSRNKSNVLTRIIA